MAYRIFTADAFTDVPFGGNPAAVCFLDSYPADTALQDIASEMNLSETAFLVPSETGKEDFELRWFTPASEVRLCGHATLAAAHILFSEQNWQAPGIRFRTRQAGLLTVEKSGGLYHMNFPADTYESCRPGDYAGLTDKPVLEAARGTDDLLLVLGSEAEVASCKPLLPDMKASGYRAVIVTAAGNGCDFVSRVFAPAVGIDEDPVTGSAHTLLAPYWGDRLGRKELTARQISRRGGKIGCQLRKDRVILSGQAVTVLKGELL